MSELSTKCREVWKRLLTQKGQGLVEFALILAFCAAIGWAASEAGFGDAISALIDSGDQPEHVTAAIGGHGTKPTVSPTDPSTNPTTDPTTDPTTNPTTDPTTNPTTDPTTNPTTDPTNPTTDPTNPTTDPTNPSGGGWGTKDPTTYYKDEDSQAERLASDQDALINIAKHFIGLTMEQVQGLLNNNTADMAESNKEVLLGHLVPVGNNKGMKFEADARLNKAEAENIFAWMQGYQDTVMSNSSNKNTVIQNDMYDPDYMYMVSDYIVSQNWADTAGSNQKNGLRMQLEYDYSCAYADDGYLDASKVKVVGVNLAIDPRSQDNEVLGQSTMYNSQSSAGLNVQVLLDGADESGNPKYIITRNNTAKHVVDNSISGNSMANWYGVNTTTTVQNYIAEKATVITNTTSETKTFTRGDIICIPGEKPSDTKYYIAVKDGTVAVQANSKQSDLEYKPWNSNIFVKFTGQPSTNYYHENDKTDYDAASQSFKKKTMTYRGFAMIMRTGEVYVYVGDQEGVVYSGVNDVDYMKIRDKQIVDDSSTAAYH